MKFGAKFGLGEIVYYYRNPRKEYESAKQDESLEVVAITFHKDSMCYGCRYANGATGTFSESELVGADDFTGVEDDD